MSDKHKANAAAERHLNTIHAELKRSRRIHGEDFHSLHEGWAVLLEEVEELREAMMGGDTAAVSEEAVQVGAMALKLGSLFGHDYTARGSGAACTLRGPFDRIDRCTWEIWAEVRRRRPDAGKVCACCDAIIDMAIHIIGGAGR